MTLEEPVVALLAQRDIARRRALDGQGIDLADIHASELFITQVVELEGERC